MTNEQKTVLRKIIYATETGGQVYGQQDYSDFTEAYENNSDEHAITIGAGAWQRPRNHIHSIISMQPARRTQGTKSGHIRTDRGLFITH